MERIGLNLEFIESNVRCSDKKICTLVAIQKNDYDKQEEIVLQNWEDFKSAYPTLKEVLIDLFETDSWHPIFAVDQHNVLFVNSVIGHDGIYEFNKSDTIEVSWPEVKSFWDNYNKS